jgi:hypothetical protein
VAHTAAASVCEGNGGSGRGDGTLSDGTILMGSPVLTNLLTLRFSAPKRSDKDDVGSSGEVRGGNGGEGDGCGDAHKADSGGADDVGDDDFSANGTAGRVSSKGRESEVSSVISTRPVHS